MTEPKSDAIEHAFAAGWEACLANYGATVKEPTNTLDRFAAFDAYDPTEIA